MSLGNNQRTFAFNVGRLIMWAYEHGWELSLGEAYRTMEQAMINTGQYKLVHIETGQEHTYPKRGILNSVHRDRLAIDLNLFKEGAYLSTTEAHKDLGAYWKSLHPRNRWGGDFASNPDGNHYEMYIG